MLRILCLLLITVSLFAKKRIELVNNGICDAKNYQKHLAGNPELEIVNCQIEKYPGLTKKKSLLGKIWTKIPITFPIDQEIQKFIFMNVPLGGKKFYNFHKLPRDKMVLFMWEPPIRLREMYNKELQKCFSKIYTWNDALVDGKTYFKFYYPAKKAMIKDRPSFEQKRFCTMIVGGTSDKSRLYPNQLYSERIKTIRFFEANEPGFVFYGRNWNPTEYPSYRGNVEDKIAVNKNYKFTICYENCRDLPGYVTEKIFDCFAAGSIPVYWGACNITDYIPKDCFIDRRDFETLEKLYAFLKDMSKEEYESYLERIDSYLNSPESDLFSEENYRRIFLEACKV